MRPTVKHMTTVKIQEVSIRFHSTTTSVTAEDTHCGMDWEITCRSVSISLV